MLKSEFLTWIYSLSSSPPSPLAADPWSCMCRNQHDIILLWKVFFKNQFFQNSVFCDFLGGTSGRIPSCLNAPSRISQLLGDNSCSLIPLCETPTYLYWDPGSEVEALLQKQQSRQQVLNAIFCETEVHSVSRLYSMIFTCWMQYHYHIYLKSFSAVAQKKSFLITQSGKSLGDQSFPMSWKGCIRRGGEVKDSYCSAAGQILYSTPCRWAAPSTGLLCSIQLQPGRLRIQRKELFVKTVAIVQHLASSAACATSEQILEVWSNSVWMKL